MSSGNALKLDLSKIFLFKELNGAMFTSLNHLVYGHFYTSEGFTLIRQKTLGKTERMPYTSTSSYSHNVFHPIREQKVFCTNFESIVSRRFRYCILATFPNRLALTFDLPN